MCILHSKQARYMKYQKAVIFCVAIVLIIVFTGCASQSTSSTNMPSSNSSEKKIGSNPPGLRMNGENGVFINAGAGLHLTKGVVEPYHEFSDYNVVLTRNNISGMGDKSVGLLIVSDSSLTSLHLYPVEASGYTFPLGFKLNKAKGELYADEYLFYWGSYSFPIDIMSHQFCEIKSINDIKVSQADDDFSSICGYSVVKSSQVNYWPGVGMSEGHYVFGEEDGCVFLDAEKGETATFGFYSGTKWNTLSIRADAIYLLFGEEIPVEIYQKHSGLWIDTSSLPNGKYVLYCSSFDSAANGYYIVDIKG